MCEMCCRCERLPGETVVAQMTEDGLMCLKCKKMIAWLPEELEDEDLDLDDDLDESLFGQAAFVCDHCKELSWWKGPEQALKDMVDDLRECDGMECPQCKEVNEITDKVREMMK